VAGIAIGLAIARLATRRPAQAIGAATAVLGVVLMVR